MHLRAAVAAGGHLEHWQQDELVDRFRTELLKDAARRIRANCNGRGADLPDAEDAADFIDPEGTRASTDELPDLATGDAQAEYVAQRAEIIDTARALVAKHTWDEPYDVSDIIRVAEFLAEGI
ncbi:hypothetical protein [Kitasatospora sp. NPDC050543]|uniref:hypothetical protein n=1 Tax=Kitasatospora sp. NPDC050543 TaxID=3364054 RepID=UPI00378C5F81